MSASERMYRPDVNSFTADSGVDDLVEGGAAVLWCCTTAHPLYNFIFDPRRDSVPLNPKRRCDLQQPWKLKSFWHRPVYFISDYG